MRHSPAMGLRRIFSNPLMPLSHEVTFIFAALLNSRSSFQIGQHDIGILPANTVHAERSPQGEVEAWRRLDLTSFDFPFDSASAPLRVRSGRAGKCPLAGEKVYESFVIRSKSDHTTLAQCSTG
jgi:hypothetical protein